MYLHKLSFRENAGQKIEWLIDEVSLGEINLIVGKNSSGKTRTLNAITDLASMLVGKGINVPGSVSYDLTFRNENASMRYELKFDQETIRTERLFMDDELLLDRGEQGRGKIKYEATPGAIFLEFEIAHNKLACYAKRDSLQHPFIEMIQEWALSLRRFDFSGNLGKSRYALKSGFDVRELDLSITNASLVPVMSVAIEKYPDYKNLVLEDMKGIGYDLLDFGISPFSERYTQADQDRYVVYTSEAGLEKQVNQRDMSQGMFRAFSVLVQLNYYILSGQKGFVIIDDIGEGLDFSRAKLLVALLIRKAGAAGIQLIMSTNDSFIMNAVDIEYWAVIMREGNKISLFNYENSREIFEEFKFTGLNNFDFYASEFFKSGFVEGELKDDLEDDLEDDLDYGSEEAPGE